MSEPMATRRELDQLAARVDSINDHGTRGVVGLQAQLNEVIKDVSALQTSTTVWQERHEQQHADDVRVRRANVKWVVTLAVMVLTSNGGILALLLTRR